MNKERLEQVEQWLLAGAPERRFDMGRVVDVPEGQKENWCGTSCCIAGYVFSQEVAFNPAKHDRHFVGYKQVEPIASAALGLSFEVSNRLFYIQSTSGVFYDGDWGMITTEQAAQAVRNVIEHGEPMWENILDFFEPYKGDV